jgi:hypothetical protein
MKSETNLFSNWPSLCPRTILLAHASFPKNRFDAEQFLNILEANEFRCGSEGEGAKPSEIIRISSNALKKRRGQGAISGLVALSYIFLKNRGVSASLEKTSKLASEAAYLAGRGAVLGSRLIDFQSQKMTVAARATAERKVVAHLS